MELRAKFLEPNVNREASKYLLEHYNEIIRQVPKMGVHEDKAEDLVNDVFVSLVEAEEEGNGYDINKANDGECILVSQFVYGRIKRYAMNSKYRTDIVEGKINKKNIEKGKLFMVVASSYDNADFDKCDSFQKAYAMAGSYDDIGDVEEEMSLRKNIGFCIEFDSIVKMSMLELFKNIDILGSLDIHKSLFDNLKDALKIHDEFADAFKSVMEYSMKHKSKFETIVSTF